MGGTPPQSRIGHPVAVSIVIKSCPRDSGSFAMFSPHSAAELKRPIKCPRVALDRA
jgi:hypothetical protein